MTKEYIVCVNPGLTFYPKFLPIAGVDTPYSADIEARNGQSPYEFNHVAGLLPSGVTFTDNGDGTATFAGTPTEAGSFSVVIRLRDVFRDPRDRTYTLQVVALPLSLSGSLADMTVGTPYSDPLTISGGIAPYSLGSILLPAGLSASVLGTTITVSGTPTGAGLGPGYSKSFDVSFTVSDSDVAAVPFAQTVGITVPTVVTTFASLLDAIEGVAYTGDVNATGGTGGYVFSLDTAPGWMSINGSTGALTGTPGSGDIGTGISVVARATDSESNFDTASDTINVSAVVGADDYVTVFGAWSVAKRLVTTYTGPLFRIRRSSDNTEQDIGFDANGDVDNAAITSFVSSNSGFVTRIYEQNASGRDFIQATTANQPRIVNAGTIDTEGAYFDGSNDTMQANIGSGNPASAIVTLFSRIRAYQNVTSNIVGGVIDCGYGSGSHIGFAVYADERTTAWSPGISVGMPTNGAAPATIKTMLNATYPMGDALHNLSARFNLTAAAGSAASLDVYRDGSNTGLLTQSNLRPTGTFTRGQMDLGKFGDISFWCEMKFRSLVMTVSDDIAQRSNVEPLL